MLIERHSFGQRQSGKLARREFYRIGIIDDARRFVFSNLLGILMRQNIARSWNVRRVSCWVKAELQAAIK